MKKIQRPDHENRGTPTKTHGATHRKAPTGTHLNKKTLKRSDSAPESTVLSKKTLRGSDSASKSTYDRSANLGRYLHKAKLPSGRKIGAAKRVADEMKSHKPKTKGY